MKVRPRYCVIGAGPCGLAAAKNLLEAGIGVDVFEREDEVGGNWYFGRPTSSVYASAHMISSKRMTQLPGLPMPKDFPPYPSHAQALAYLRDYARHFQLYDHIQFHVTVARAEPISAAADCPWQVTLADGRSQQYDGLVVANGHHSVPRVPELPGNFTGETLHARDYKTPDQLAGKRVLIVGGGNSGCDIAVESARHARRTILSLRRGYHFLPKFLFGGPLDSGGQVFERWRVPMRVQQWVTSLLARIALGRPERYGLPAPDHRLFETHPIVNSQLLYCVGHGQIEIRRAIERVDGQRVTFAGGCEEEVDLMIFATGYQTSFPFFDRALVLDDRGAPKLYLNAFHPHFDTLMVAGLIQPNGAIWPLADLQAQVMARFIVAREESPRKADWFRQQKRQGPVDVGGGLRYDRSERHHLEVEFFAYRRQLRKLLKRLM